jgi:hypothetical protein
MTQEYRVQDNQVQDSAAFDSTGQVYAEVPEPTSVPEGFTDCYVGAVPEAAISATPAAIYKPKSVTVTKVSNGYIVSYCNAHGDREELIATDVLIRGYEIDSLGSVLAKVFGI